MSGKERKRKKSGHLSASERQLGALTLRTIDASKLKHLSRKRFLPFVLTDGFRLFCIPSATAVSKAIRRFQDLGLADLLAPLSTSGFSFALEPKEQEGTGRIEKRDLEQAINELRLDEVFEDARKDAESVQRICAALGANAASIESFAADTLEAWREFGELEAEAWFLSLFAYFYRNQAAEHADIADRFMWAMALGNLMLLWRLREQGIDQDAVLQAEFKAGRDKKLGPKVGSEKSALRRRVIAEIVNELREVPRKGTRNVHWGKLSKEVRKMAAEKALYERENAFTEEQRRRIDSLNEIARQGDATIKNQIRAGKVEGQIRKIL